MGMRNRHRLALTVVASAGAVAGLLVGAQATPAQAAGTVAGKVITNGLVLNVRSEPSTAKARTAMLSNGARVTIVCQSPGQKIRGAVRTTKLWDRLVDGTYVSDGYIARGKTPVLPCAQVDAPGVGQVQPPATHAPTVSTGGWASPIPGVAGSGYRTKQRPTHDGVDIGAYRNTPILAATGGTVITAECNASTDKCDVDGSTEISGCGWYVEIQHVGRVVTRYCHMVRRPLVVVGQRVAAAQIIGYVGTSGNSSGPHLHFEVHTNAAPATRRNAIEPVAFLKAKGVTLRPLGFLR
jgi:murein DD-endopeptidase MepM/ murein hydrolase activator NlpD